MFAKQLTVRDECELKRRSEISQKKLGGRTMLSCVFILVTIPLTIWFGIYVLRDRSYYFISMAIILQTMLPFFLSFERRKPQAREIVLIATLAAIAVAGRGAFFWLPQFKPVVAMVIIVGVTLGAEAGFLTGALSFFVSNFFFGQGPWTPWQMFCGGIIGFLAGVLFRKGLLKTHPVILGVFGFFATWLIYGGLVNIGSVLMFSSEIHIEHIVTAYVSGLPFDLIHAVATLIFMLIISKPMIEKIDRIKTKYGLLC